jgi:hypothetical protein
MVSSSGNPVLPTTSSRENLLGPAGVGVLGDETKSGNDRGARAGRRWTFVARVFFWVVLAVGLAYFSSPFLYGALFGDRGKETLRIENRTDETLLVYSEEPDGSEHRLTHTIPPVPPAESVQTDFPCAATELVARTGDGDLVARRGPFEECNQETWVIEPAPGD